MVAVPRIRIGKRPKRQGWEYTFIPNKVLRQDVNNQSQESIIIQLVGNLLAGLKTKTDKDRLIQLQQLALQFFPNQQLSLQEAKDILEENSHLLDR